MTQMQNRLSDDHQALKPLALLAAGLTGADVERLVRELRAHCRRQGVPITWHALEEALLMGRNVPSATVAPRVAVHESGHALAYELLGVGKVHHVRIGGSRGGETLAALSVDTIQTEEGLMKWIACILAGRAAELLVFGSTLAGSGGSDESDLAKATQLAVDLETSCGTATHMPLIYRPPANPAEAILYNPLLAERVNARLETAEAMAVKLLEEHRAALEELARLLVERQVIDGDDVRAVLAEAAASAIEPGRKGAIPKPE